MRVAVTNAVLSNTGDAAIFQGIIDSLVDSGVCAASDVIVFDANASVTRRLYPDWTIHQQLTVAKRRKPARLGLPLQRVRTALGQRLARKDRLLLAVLETPFLSWTDFAKSYKALSKADVVISSGGTYLVDHYNFAPRVLESEIVKSLGLQLILWTQSMGPFRSERAVGQASRIGELVDEVFFRDQRSADAWERTVTLDVPREVVADVVFALDTARTDAPQNYGKRRALISVREWTRGVESGEMSSDRYRDMMRAGASALSESGLDVVALSTCQGVPSYAYDDSAVALAMFESLPVEVDRSFHTPAALVEAIRKSEVVVATRMHLAILALISQKPVIAIAYEFKTVELFEALGMGHLVIRIENADPAWLRQTIASVLADPASAVLSVERLTALRQSARRPAVSLLSRVRH